MSDGASESSREERVNAILAEWLQATDAGREFDRAELLARHPDLTDDLRSFFADHDAAARLAPPPVSAEAPTLAPGEVPSAPPPPMTVRYFGDYELLTEIARGGMGVVYRARQVSLNRVVALKMILAGQLAGADDVERFRLEAQTAAALQHPHIVTIHEVGEHEGQHYFSMDFVEGKSLADLVRDNPLPPQQAAQHVRLIAQAIQYAHQRGVLHRDLKPSNVLIDHLGQPRVTDFGLAKRIDKDAGLTATGAVVGTPSYMPPEQASGQRGAMGPASDVYSLGAVLYELVTGRPPFRAATPLDTLLQVLEAEPAPPRLLNPAVGRDLETIILKCLHKEPAKRYASAQELADDLGAFLDGRPIKARRPGLAERALRWAQTQRRSAAIILLTATASALLLLGGTLGWTWYTESRLGRLLVRSGTPPFRVEVLDDAGRTVVKPFATVTPGPVETDPVPLPAGDFNLCLSASGARGETYRLLVERGLRYNVNLSPEPRRLWEPLQIKPGDFAEVTDLRGDGAHIILVQATGLQWINGATRDPIKDWGPGVLGESAVGRLPEFDWKLIMQARRPWFVQPAPVVGDDRLLLWASRSTPSLLAASGKTGRLLWWHRARPAPPPGIDEAQVDFVPAGGANLSQGQVIAEPLVADLDSKPVLVVTFASNGEAVWIKKKDGPSEERGRSEPEEWIEALDAATGERLWRRSLGPRSSYYPLENMKYAAGLLTVEGRPVVAVLANRRLLGLDLRTGAANWSHDLEPIVGRSGDSGQRSLPRFGTFGAPGKPGVLIVFDGGGEAAVAAVSLETGRPLWQRTLPIRWVPYLMNPRDEPLVADLDGDGRPEVILAYGEPASQANRAAVEVLDGATGERRWRYLFPTVGQIGLLREQWLRVTAGPDLDGDGRREVFVASRYTTAPDEDPRVYVEALSGSDGRPLWRWSHPFWGGDRLGPLSWWDQPGADGWPQLLVPVTNQLFATTDHTFVLAAGTGRLTQVIDGFRDARQADLIREGIPALWTFQSSVDQGSAAPGGALTALRGTAPEAWRRLGHWLPVGELDGDGIADVVNAPATASGTVAVSGRDGRILWQSSAASGQAVLPLPLPYGDLDGDSTADLLLFASIEGLSAVSGGNNGRVIWNADFKGKLLEQMTLHMLECRDLDGDGTPEVLLAYSQTPPKDQFHAQLKLAVVSLKDGKTRWRTTLSPPDQNNAFANLRLLPAFADLDGDGVLDVVVWGMADDDTLEVRALSGRDGSPLWRRSLSRQLEMGIGHRPAVAAGDLGGPPVVIVDCGNGEVWALDATGERLWMWQEPIDVQFVQRPAPVFLDLAGGGRGVCVSGLPGGRAVFLDAQGRAVQSVADLRPIRQGHPGKTDQPEFFRLLPGVDGLLSIAEGKLRLTRGGIERKNQVWEWPLPGGSGEVMEVLGQGERTTVVVRAGFTAHGLDVATGRERWRCAGPCPPTGLLPARDPAASPHVLFAQDGGATTCRLALEVGPDGRYLLPVPAPVTFEPLPEDPRLPVPLPWWHALRELRRLDWPSFLLVQVASIFTVVLSRSAAGVFRRGARLLSLLLGGLLLALLALIGGLIYLRSAPNFSDPYSPWVVTASLALIGWPPLNFLWRTGAWAVQGRWRRVALLLTGSIVLTLPLAGCWLWTAAGDIGPTQHYATDGWYSAWIMGAYAAGALLFAGWLLRASYRFVRRAGRWTFRLIRPVRMAPTA
jgi:outer membrane protein assembly factor BamB